MNDTKKPHIHGMQETFLNRLRRDNVAVTVFLINGIKLQGVITWFDNFSLMLQRDAHSQLVYKHAISTIMPGVPVNVAAEAEADDDE